MLISFVFTFNGCTKNKQLTQKQKLDDFEYMYTILKENYPYFEVNKRMNKLDWLLKKNSYIAMIKDTKDDESYFNTLQKILCELNNGHTSMLNKNMYTSWKSSFNEFDAITDKAWLNQLNNSKAVERYAKMPDIKDSNKIASNRKASDNVKTAILKKDETAYFSIQQMDMNSVSKDMETLRPFLESIKDYKKLIIDIRGNGGGGEPYWMGNIVPMLINKPLTDTSYWAFRGGDFVNNFLESRYNGLEYVLLTPMTNIKNENLKNMPPELMKDFKYYKKAEKCIGPTDSIGFKGKIYLLVDGNVFSSSEAFAVFAKDTDFATLVGETTGGDGIGFDPAVCTLPNSGYVFQFPLDMGLTSDGICNFEHRTKPDIEVSAKKESDFSNDEAVQTILKLTN